MRASRWMPVALALAAAFVASGSSASGKAGASGGGGAKGKAAAAKPWCAPEVKELADHVCYFDGGPTEDGRHTLVVYLHGLLADTPGFQYLQQRGMAIHAKRQHFTVLLPTSPRMDANAFAWPTGRAAQAEHEAKVLAGIKAQKSHLERVMNTRFDETFVVGFSSGAYYGSSVAMRGLLDVDGFMVLAGGSTWARKNEGQRRVPIFVGVSAADAQTAEDSRSLAATLGAMGWPYRVEERNAGHMVDWTFMDHGLAWLRSQTHARKAR